MPHRNFLLLGSLLIGGVLLVYSPAFRSDFVGLDDAKLVMENATVTSFDVPKAFASFDPELYIPLTLLTYQIEYALFEDNPLPYHLANLALHVITTVLLILWLQLLTGKTWPAFLAGAIFALHPINTEAVMWVSARKDLLCAMFFFGSLLAYEKYRKHESRGWFTGCLVLFLCALLSKVTAVTLPLVILLADGLKKRETGPLSMVPLSTLSLIFLVIAMFGKVLGVSILGYWQTILLAMKSTTFALLKFILPTNLGVFYPQTTPITITSFEFLLPIVILLALFVLIVLLRRKVMWASFGFCFFLLTLLPSLGGFARPSKESIFFFSDRYAYIPNVGLALAAAIGIVWLFERSSKFFRHILVVFVVLVVLVLGLATERQSLVWANSESLFENATEVAPGSHLAWTLYGQTELSRKNLIGALFAFDRALEANPTYVDALTHRGLTEIKLGEFPGAHRDLDAALQKKPNDIHGLLFSGLLALREERFEDADEIFRSVLEMDPTNTDAAYLLRRSFELRNH